MLLISSGYRKDGSACFPVTDVQGNIRGYANTSGVQSAYAYYPYGTLIDLAHDDAEDSRRWQAKEFDSDLNKYYFGARFYDPLFGLWLAPDPAGQFANPYTYGGDPLNYIDPNGESVTAAIAIGAAVGAAIGGTVSAVNCSGANEVGCGRAVAQGVAVGAVAGAASGGVGSAVSGLATGAAGVLMESGSAAAFAGGAVGGAAGSAAGYTSSYFLNNTLGNRSEWSWLGWNGFLAQVGIGTVLGGMLSEIRFQTDVNYQWSVYEETYSFGKRFDFLNRVANYIGNEEGLASGTISVDMTQEYFRVESATSKTGFVDAEGMTDNLGNIKIAKSATTSAANFYETIAHEGLHQKFNYMGSGNMGLMFNNSIDAEEALVRDRLLDHKFNKFWSNERAKEIADLKTFIERKSTSKQTIKTLETFGNRRRLYNILLETQ